MIHIGNLDQLQLPTLLERIQLHQKTGKVIIICEDKQEDIYIDRGQVVIVSSLYDKELLLRRLMRSGVISLDELQQIPANIGQIISQPQSNKRYSDVQIAKVLLKLGVVSSEQLANWVQQENTKALERLLSRSNGQIYFEEGVQLPSDHLYLFLETLASRSLALYDTTPLRSNEEGETSLVSLTPAPTINAVTPITPFPHLLKKSLTITEEKIIPVTPSGFVRLPATIDRTLAIPAVQVTQAVIQRTAAVIHPHLPIDDTLTERIPTPPKPNPLFKWETLLIIAVLLLAGLAHGINMFHYPYYEDDEGTYLSQAWAVLHLGRLAYYTYWYDHAPAGWILIALWAALTGGFHTFGSAMNSGRIFMLLLQLGSTFILYRIARIISKSMVIAIIVALLFALSPYGLYYHRRILLDNIMTFWMLLSILPLLTQPLSLKRVWFSAIALAISILSKEVDVFIIPALAYLVWIQADKLHRTIAISGWFTILCIIVSLYPLLAIVKGELFPTGTFLGGNNPHVSLIGTLLYQGSRGKDGGIFSFSSMFWYRTMIWVKDDPLLVVGGSVCAVIAVLLIRKRPLIGGMGLITLLLWSFIARGGVVLDFYLIPLIPMLALSFGIILGMITRFLGEKVNNLLKVNTKFGRITQPAIILLCLISIVALIPPPSSGVGYGASNVGSQADPLILWNGTQADAQNEAVAWVEEHIPKNSGIIIDMYMWPDLYSDGYKYVHYYWKLEADPAIQDGVFHNNWRNVDYLITTPQMLLDMQDANMTLVKALIENSSTVAAFDTGYWRIDIRKVHK